jgi:hypothetical protein
MTSGTSNTKYTSYFVSNNHAMGGGEPKAAEDQLKQDRIMKTGCHGDPQVSEARKWKEPIGAYKLCRSAKKTAAWCGVALAK